MMTLGSEAILGQIENFAFLKNSESAYYYEDVPIASESRESSIRKILDDLDILIAQNRKLNPANEKDKSKALLCDATQTCEYIRYLLANENRYSFWCKNLLKNVIEVVLQKGNEIIDKHVKTLQTEANMILTESQIKLTFSEFFFSQINDHWFKQESFLEDKTFRLTCEVLDFLRLEHLIALPNSAKIERHLQGSIELLKELDYTFSLDDKFHIIQKVLENISYLIHYTNDTEFLPGNEVILNVFIWCIIQTKNSTLKSTLRYLELFIDDEHRSGEMGFTMTQLEASIIYLGRANEEKISRERVPTADDFETKLLWSENQKGVHSARTRPLETYSKLRFEKPALDLYI